MKEARDQRSNGWFQLSLSIGGKSPVPLEAKLPENKEPSSAEVALVVAFYNSARAEITHYLDAGDKTNTQFLTIALAGVVTSLTAEKFNVNSLSFVCCLTPMLSFVFSKQRTSQVTNIVNIAKFIRVDLNSYFQKNFPNVRSGRLDIVNWEEFTMSEKAERLSIKTAKASSFFTLHFPSIISLSLAGYILASQIFLKIPDGECKSFYSFCLSENWKANAWSRIPILGVYSISIVFWILAVRETFTRLRFLEKAVDNHRQAAGRERSR